MNMHPNIQALIQLPPPNERTIHGDIPIYYLQVPAHYVVKIRGPDAPDPPLYVEVLLVSYSVLILSPAIAGVSVRSRRMLMAFAHGYCHSRMAQ